MTVWSYPDIYDYGHINIVESDAKPVIANVEPNLVKKVSDKAVYLVEHYWAPAYDKTRYFDQKVFQNKVDALKQAELSERSYRLEEDCEWHAHVVPAPLL